MYMNIQFVSYGANEDSVKLMISNSKDSKVSTVLN